MIIYIFPVLLTIFSYFISSYYSFCNKLLSRQDPSNYQPVTSCFVGDPDTNRSSPGKLQYYTPAIMWTVHTSTILHDYIPYRYLNINGLKIDKSELEIHYYYYYYYIFDILIY